MIARMVWSHVQFALISLFLGKWRNFLTLHDRESIMGPLEGGGGFGLAGREGIGDDPGTIRAVGVNFVGVYRK